MPATVLQLRVSLEFIRPEIWRRFLVDSTTSIHKLHGIVQAVMGWEDCHLYSFQFHGEKFELPAEDAFFKTESQNSTKVKLKDLGLEPKNKLCYTYDFGDSWEHVIVVEKELENSGSVSTPLCIDGERNCPPEDCGSVPGYENIVNAMKNKKSREAQELIRWLGEPYDPEKFDISVVNARLKPRSARKRTS